MSASVIRFEVLLPVSQIYNNNFDPTALSAINTFFSNLSSLTKVYQYQTNATSDGENYMTAFGYITASQTSSALSYLSTLNSTIGSQYTPIECVVIGATSEP
jgi:hypothetical protein